MSGRTFSELGTAPHRAYGVCTSCGASLKEGMTGTVQIRVTERSGRDHHKQRQVASKSRALCESCSVQMYEELLVVLQNGTGA